MAIFPKVIPALMVLEGGESDSKSDYGGLTKYGVSQKDNPGVDIADLTLDDAAKRLKINYWDFYHLGDINDQGIAQECFFIYINMAPSHAATIIQKAINACGRGIIAVTQDGILGSASIKALNSIAPFWLGDRIRLEACRYYLAEADRDPKQRENFRGWIRRAVNM